MKVNGKVQKKRDLHMFLLTWKKKAYDFVPREVLWKTLEKKDVCMAYIRAIQNMYEGITPRGKTQDFPSKIGLHQDWTLSPF